MGKSEKESLRAAYATRDEVSGCRRGDSPLDPGHLFIVRRRQCVTASLLEEIGIETLSGMRILEVGCGEGNALAEYLGFGVRGKDLFGVDVVLHRLTRARSRMPGVGVICAQGSALPFEDGTFDCVVQYTAFSSILEKSLRQKVAREMTRVVRSGGGIVIWYDFWMNPTNRRTRGIGLGELKSLFPHWRVESRRITLAPPLSRVLARRWPSLGAALESLKFLNTHYLAVLIPPEE